MQQVLKGNLKGGGKMKRLALFFVVSVAIFATTIVFGCSEDPVGEGGSYIPKADGPGEGGSYVPKVVTPNNSGSYETIEVAMAETDDGNSSSSSSSSSGSAATGSISG